eukprot:6456678-Amphidinium_carterae.2
MHCVIQLEQQRLLNGEVVGLVWTLSIAQQPRHTRRQCNSVTVNRLEDSVDAIRRSESGQQRQRTKLRLTSLRMCSKEHGWRQSNC